MPKLKKGKIKDNIQFYYFIINIDKCIGSDIYVSLISQNTR